MLLRPSLPRSPGCQPRERVMSARREARRSPRLACPGWRPGEVEALLDPSRLRRFLGCQARDGGPRAAGCCHQLVRGGRDAPTAQDRASPLTAVPRWAGLALRDPRRHRWPASGGRPHRPHHGRPGVLPFPPTRPVWAVNAGPERDHWWASPSHRGPSDQSDTRRYSRTSRASTIGPKGPGRRPMRTARRTRAILRVASPYNSLTA